VIPLLTVSKTLHPFVGVLLDKLAQVAVSSAWEFRRCGRSIVAQGAYLSFVTAFDGWTVCLVCTRVVTGTDESLSRGTNSNTRACIVTEAAQAQLRMTGW
jgi:hypothetical protein